MDQEHAAAKIVVRGTTAIFVALLLCLGVASYFKNRDLTDPRIRDAESLIGRQVASDIEVSFDREHAKAYSSGGRTYVCGSALLNHPGSGPLALDHVNQRVVVTLSGNAGIAEFDGRPDPEGRAMFESMWINKCH